MEERMRIIFLVSLLTTVQVSALTAPDCPCVPAWMCRTVPYGAHDLDIAVFGLLMPCSLLGTVRCCPRDGLEETPTSRKMVQQTSGVSTEDIDMDSECECVPPGICLPQFVTPSSHCQELDELCCIPNSDVNTAVHLFNTELLDNSDTGHLDDIPLHKPTAYEEINNDDDIVISQSKPEDGPGDDSDNDIVPCVPGLMCAKLYGYHPLDIARFGTLPHCSQRGLVRCVELKAPISRQPSLFGHDNAYSLACVPIQECNKIYGFDQLDIAKFGVLPPCARHGFARCIQLKDTTGSPLSSELSPNTSPSIISSEDSTGLSPSTSPHLIFSEDSTGSSPRLIISDTQQQSAAAVDCQIPTNENQDFSSDVQNTEEIDNANTEERAGNFRSEPAKVPMDGAVVDDVVNEFTSTEIDSDTDKADNTDISESIFISNTSKNESKFVVRDRNEDYWFLSKYQN